MQNNQEEFFETLNTSTKMKIHITHQILKVVFLSLIFKVSLEYKLSVKSFFMKLNNFGNKFKKHCLAFCLK